MNCCPSNLLSDSSLIYISLSLQDNKLHIQKSQIAEIKVFHNFFSLVDLRIRINNNVNGWPENTVKGFSRDYPPRTSIIETFLHLLSIGTFMFPSGVGIRR